MKDRLLKYKLVWLSPLVAIAVLSLIVFLLPVAFSACDASGLTCKMWFYLSASADVYGTGIIALILGLVLMVNLPGIKTKLRIVFLNFVLICSCLGILASLNEYVIKPLTHVARPSEEYLSNASRKIIVLPDLFSKHGDAKNNYIADQIQKNIQKLKGIPDDVLKSWIADAGYSFPSGHSQNAFLLGTILCYLMVELLPERRKWMAALPFIWSIMVCLSRVALGVHSKWDVTAGALSGTILALIFVSLGIYERIYFKKLNITPVTEEDSSVI